MTMQVEGKAVWRLEVLGEEQTAALAADLAPQLRSGDIVALAGDLGVGKTVFARALIRALTGVPQLEIPSPTFTLAQVYQGPSGKIVHADFYRIKSASEVFDIGWDEIAEDAIIIVEWAEHARELFQDDRLEVRLSFAEPGRADARLLTVSGHGGFAARLTSIKSIREFLRDAGWGDARRAFLQGDASSRSYETLENAEGERAILMISPQRPDGPPIRFGKSYSGVAHLAESISAFIAMSEGLIEQGVSAPRILARNLDAGLAIIEDLGREGFVKDDAPIADRYLEAVLLLARLHSNVLPDTLPLEGRGVHRILPYDLDALLIEVEQLLDWYVARASASGVSSGARATFVNLWRQALLEIVASKPTWTLRDYHSPNLLWLPDREGVRRVGVIDYQDCVLGHPAYDVVSLAQDARVTVSNELEMKLITRYALARRELDPGFDMGRFAKAYAILGAQRATKILGIFARLDRRDHKPQYLAHLPRVEAYLRKNLRHPALQDVKAWYVANLPALLADGS